MAFQGWRAAAAALVGAVLGACTAFPLEPGDGAAAEESGDVSSSSSGGTGRSSSQGTSSSSGPETQWCQDEAGGETWVECPGSSSSGTATSGELASSGVDASAGPSSGTGASSASHAASSSSAGTSSSQQCQPGTHRNCYTGPAGTAGHGICTPGSQTCSTAGRWGTCTGSVLPATEVCGNNVDEDCNGADLACQTVNVTVTLDADCETVSCPSSAPYPVGCDVEMWGHDGRMCVASKVSNRAVYFQEGNSCGAGKVRGTLSCSSHRPSHALDSSNCDVAHHDGPPYDEFDHTYYVSDDSECP